MQTIITAEQLMRRQQLSEREARIVAETVPLRGTMQWHEREVIRRSIGCRCISVGDL